MPPKYRSYTKPQLNRRAGRPAKMKMFNAPLPQVKKATTTQSVATPGYVKKYVRKAIKNAGETKFLIQGYNRQTLYHNGGTSGVSGACQFNLLAPGNLPVQGDEDTQRDGNKIIVKGVRLNMLITFPYDRLASKVILYVVRVYKGYNPLGAYANMFDSVSSNWLLDSIDTGRVKVYYKKIFTCGKINPNVPVAGANREITIPRVMYIKLNKVINFLDNGSQDHSYPYDFIVVAAAYDAWGSLSSDSIAYLKLDQKLYFKDL